MNEENKHGKLLFTTNYDMFQLSKQNRIVNKEHLRTLINAIEKNNQLDVNPIIVNSEFEVINGQHRLLAAKHLNVPIYYIQKDSNDIHEDYILTANMYQRSTRPSDSIRYYSECRNNHDYIILKKCQKNVNIPPGAMANLIGANVNYRKNGRVINEGEFKLKYPDVIIFDLLERYKNIVAIIKNYPLSLKNIWHSPHFCGAFQEIYTLAGWNWEIFEKKVRLHWKLLDVRLYSRDDWKKRFLEVYNKGARLYILNDNEETKDD